MLTAEDTACIIASRRHTCERGRQDVDRVTLGGTEVEDVIGPLVRRIVPEVIGASAAGKDVRAGAADQRVIAVAAEQQIGSASTIQGVITTQADQDVVTIVAT